MPIIGDRHEISLKSVIYATDFSVGSQNAGLYAARLASYFSADLFVAHAFTLSQAAMEAEIDPLLVSRQRADLQSLLAVKVKALAFDKLGAIPKLLEGDPREAIPELAESNAPSLIALGTHGGGWVERSLIGSVAEAILRSTRWPSLTVGPRVRPLLAKALPFNKILCATDFSAAAAQAVVLAISLAETFGSALEILHVIHDEDLADQAKLSGMQRHFHSTLNGLLPYSVDEYCDSRFFVAVGRAHQRIIKHIKEHAIDLLVLGIRKTSHLGLEMRTSGAFRLIAEADCPVLTIKV